MFTDTLLRLIGSQVSDLKENRKYQFQVRAANIAGVGVPSLPSDIFLCEEWTIAVPGGSDLSPSDPSISCVFYCVVFLTHILNDRSSP